MENFIFIEETVSFHCFTLFSLILSYKYEASSQATLKSIFLKKKKKKDWISKGKTESGIKIFKE